MKSRLHFQNPVVRSRAERVELLASSSNPVLQAFGAWLNLSAYLGPGGHYRLKPLDYTLPKKYRTRGGTAPWNALIRNTFPDNSSFHAAAHAALGEDSLGRPLFDHLRQYTTAVSR